MMMASDETQPDFQGIKANILHRFIAKFLDFLIVAACSTLIPPIGFFAGIGYLLIADGFWQGQSVGKRIIGLYTLTGTGAGVGSFKESIIRNSPLGLGWAIGSIPYIGWIVLGAIVVVETLLIIGNDRGKRIGDEIAHTQVMDRLPVTQSSP